jgi:predicted hotdog family 3-hydroxylacyl-ACP dehydratase
MAIDRASLAALIPHHGQMCLLDQVIGWDQLTIECRTDSHRDPANPLTRGGRLAGVHAFEYGAQAAAVHGGLLAKAEGRAFRPGLLCALRDARLHVPRLDSVEGSLRISATFLAGDDCSASYRFVVGCDRGTVAEARMTIITW